MGKGGVIQPSALQAWPKALQLSGPLHLLAEQENKDLTRCLSESRLRRKRAGEQRSRRGFCRTEGGNLWAGGRQWPAELFNPARRAITIMALRIKPSA